MTLDARNGELNWILSGMFALMSRTDCLQRLQDLHRQTTLPARVVSFLYKIEPPSREGNNSSRQAGTVTSSCITQHELVLPDE